MTDSSEVDSSAESDSHTTSNSAAIPTGQLGLLDLAVDLSAAEVYSGADFTVYLHIKNPFGCPVWIRSVELSLPTQLSARLPNEPDSRRRSRTQRANDKLLRDMIARRETNIRRLAQDFTTIEAAEARAEQEAQIEELRRLNDQDLERLTGRAALRASKDGSIRIDRVRTPNIYVTASEGGSIRIDDYQGTAEPERVPLRGSLPQGSALQPGSTDVWTIRLGSSRNILFIPAKYRLQITVIYGVKPEDDSKESSVTTVGQRNLYSNTTAFNVAVRAALWNLLIGGVIGGLFGSLGRSLQASGNPAGLIGQHIGYVVGALALAVILSGAAVIFSARKTEAQSFVTVEDFWGGILVGFLIGYGGTAAFAQIAGLHG